MDRLILKAWAAAFILGVAVAAPAAQAAQAAPVVTESVAIDCLKAAFFGERSEAADADLLDLLGVGAAPELRSTSTCVRKGKGALAYCEGACTYTHQTCKEVISGTGFSCSCS
jgi:hypothetical protein